MSTVKELLEALSNFPADAEVGVETGCCTSGSSDLRVQYHGARVWIEEVNPIG